MAYVQTQDQPTVYRDTESKGLVSTDRRALAHARASRAAVHRSVSQQERVSNMEQRLDRMETMLSELSRHVLQLVASRTDASEQSE